VGLKSSPSLHQDHDAILDHFFELGDLLEGPPDDRG
jgi:hypothetical protein